MAGKSCEFFKVYLSQLSCKQLGLPPAFVWQLGEKIPKNCTIKDPKGTIWPVKLESAKAGLVVADGWQDFASHHSLVDGDFLVFDYDGDSQFGVKIYGINGLQKRKAPDSVASTSGVKKGRQQGVEALSNSLPLRTRPQGLRMHVQAKRLGSNLPVRPLPLVLRPKRGKLNKIRTRSTPSKAKETATNFTSRYPYFKQVISPSALLNELSVPGKFVIDHIKPRMEYAEQRAKLPGTKLLTAGGKWSVTLNVHSKYNCKGILQAGWARFSRDNFLEVGDECFFELINNEPVVMKVSIFKHNG